MKRLTYLYLPLLVSSIFSLNACISSSGSGTNVADGGMTGTGIVQGTVSGFGSVFVNGIEFSTNNANFTRNGSSSSESDFNVGDVVTIQGAINADGTSGTATSILYQGNILGLVTQSATNGNLEVLGQAVDTDNLTAFEGFTLLSEVTTGVTVEVSGIVKPSGGLLATRISIIQDTPGTVIVSRVTGAVENLDLATQTFSIGNLTVDFSGATLAESFNGVITDGLSVQVATSQNVSGTLFMAETVETGEITVGGNAGDLVGIEGIVTDLTTTGNFSIGNQLVRISSATQLKNGTAADLADGAQAEIIGQLDENNTLVAETVGLRPASTVGLEAPADAVNLVDGTVTILGSIASVDNLTKRADKSSAEIKTFGLKDVSAGDRLKILGFIKSDGTLVVTKLEREDPEMEIEIQGPAKNPDSVAGSVEVLGITFTLQTSGEIEDANGNPLSLSGFFSSLQAGITVIKVKGTLTSNTTASAEEIEVEEIEFDEVDSDSDDFSGLGGDGDSDPGADSGGDAPDEPDEADSGSADEPDEPDEADSGSADEPDEPDEADSGSADEPDKPDEADSGSADEPDEADNGGGDEADSGS